MSEENSSINVTKDDLDRDTQLLFGASTTVMRINLDKYQRRMAILQHRKMDIEWAMMLMKAKIYNNYDISTIEQKFLPDQNMTVEPKNGYAYADIGFQGPHQSVAYDRDQMERRTEGLKELKNELDRYNNEYLRIQEQIRYFDKRIKVANAQIQLNEKNNTGISQADIQANKIQNSRKVSLYLLYQLHVMYRQMTADPKDINPDLYLKKRAYPENDVKATKDLLIYQQIFRAYAMAFSDLLQGETALDLIDPGADKNKSILSKKIAVIQASAKDEKTVEDKVNKFVSSLQSTLQDPQNSQGILRGPEPTVAQSNSMRAHNKTYPAAMVNVFGKVYQTAYSFPNLDKAVSDWFKKKISGNYLGLPPCTTPTLSESDKARLAMDAAQAAAVSAGTKKVQQSDAKAGA